MRLLLSVLSGLLTLAYARAEYLQEFEIRENVPPGTVIGYIGQPKNGATHRPPAPPYFVVPVANSDVDSDLVVVTTTGEIRTNTTLDRETRAEYSFTAIPSKHGENVRVIIKVLDENDNPPEFPSSFIRIDFAENAPRDAKRTLAPARDRDLGLFNTQFYSIISGNTNNAFKLSYHRERDDVLYLDLQVNGVLDREITPNFSLTIEAYDGGTPPLKGVLQVNITIQDVNDNQPIFSQGNYVATIAENATVGTSVLRVLATDTDEGGNGEVRYSINRRQSDREQYFNIDPKSGEIFVNKPLDFETKESHELVVVARDNGLQPLETTTFVSIKISDINDNTPTISLIFLSDDASSRIREDAKVGDFVGRISVSDPDSREEYANLINVTLHGGDGHFGLYSKDNVIYLMVVNVPLDRERQANFTMTIMATDQGIPPLKTSKQFTLHISDVNDNAPRFTQSEYFANIPEIAEPGFSVIRIRATDRDEGVNAALRYELQNDVNGWFKMDPASGIVTTKSFIDCETNPSPVLTVVARDKGTPSLSSTAKLTVTVSDVNDNEPLFDQSYYNVTVPEDARIGTCVLKVAASDPDCGVNAVVNFTLGPSSSPSFRIDARSGELCIAAKLDREARSAYEIPVLATDRGGLSTATVVKVHVLDINDHRPVFNPVVYNVSLYEFYDQTVLPIVVVVAEDHDEGLNGQVSYRIVEGNHQLFRIDPDSGGIHVTSTLRRGSGISHHLVVSAQDGQGLRSEQNAHVYISVLSERQRPPVFVSPRYVFAVREDIVPRSVIGNVTAKTADQGLQGIRYAIRSGNDEGYFAIDAIRGLISVEKPLDFESASSVLLSVQAASGIPLAFGHAQVNISILDVNDNSPRFESNFVRMSVPENSSLLSPVYFVHAEDADSGENGRISYSLAEESENFKVNGRSGAIILKRSLDYERRQQHRLTVIAEDGATPARRNNMTLLVEVQDINDNAPVFEYESYRISIEESMEVDTEFLRVTAADSDSGNNARLTYRLVDSPSASPNFGIYPNTGYVYLRESLDREVEDSYIIQVEAVDNGNPPLSASTTVYIAVSDANDNEPQFVRDMFEFAVEENVEPGRFVGEIRAVDKDLGDNAVIRYSLLSNNDEFNINPITGEMHTKNRLDREKRSNYECIVEAQDQGTKPKSSRVTVRVRVLDKNDNAPVFAEGQETSFNLRRDEPAGSEVGQIRTSDADEGTNAEVVYELEATGLPTDGVKFFAINTDGLIKTKTELSQGKQKDYTLRVVAKDLGSPSLETKADVRITVRDLNDKLLSFYSSTVTFTVKEGVLPGHEIGIVEAAYQDKSQSAGIQYSITGGNDKNIFSIDRVTGVLYTNVEIDYEVNPSFALQVSASDSTGAPESKASIVNVNVRVEDTNDNPPQFTSDPIAFSVSENTSPGSLLNAITAHDEDSGANGEVRYSIIEPNGSGKPTFTIDPVTGVITLIEPLDYERQAQYIFVVEAMDQAREAELRLSSKVTVTLLVEDENDNAPEIVSKPYVQVFEDRPVETVVATILALDKDSRENGRILFSIQGGDTFGNFRLNESSGELVLVRPLDLNQATEIVLNITVRDNGQPMHFTHEKLHIKVRDSTDIAPLFVQKVYETSISESAAVGSVFLNVAVPNVTASLHNISYTLKNDATIPFSIDSASGEIRTTRPLDRERISRYNLTVFGDHTTYPASQYDSAIVIVDVLDVNDNVPDFGDSCYNLSVPENREWPFIHRLHASDNDLLENGEVVYSIEDGNFGNVFSIAPLSGNLSCKALDRESASEYSLVILAQDRGAPPKIGRCRLWITVMDQNDNDPQFEHSEYSPQVREDAEIGTEVLMVNAHDIDEKNNGEVTYSLINATNSLFSIDSDTGRIYTTGQFDRENEPRYTLEVRASDRGSYETRSHSATVHIAITDANDNKPIFVRYPFFAEIRADAQIGTHVEHVVAEDDDEEGRNSDIIYSFSESGVHSEYFHINPHTGEVTLARRVHNFEGKVLHLEIVASDQGEHQKSSVGVLEVHVGTTSNEHQLQFLQERYTVEISESANYGMEILTVRAEDYWKHSYDISYSLDSDSDEFSINAQSGVIRVNNSLKLDYEHQQSVSAIIIAKSVRSGEPRYGYARLEVNLRNENDNAPRFSQSSYEASVYEGRRRGESVVQVSAIDEDGEDQKLFFQIIDGNHDNAFTIDPPSSGIIKTNTVLDREIRENYVLVVTASDEMSPPLSGTTTVLISIVDINDNQPVFPASDPVKVREDCKVGSVVVTVEANDVDTFPPLVYSLKTGENSFNVDAFTGAITLSKPLDFEAQRNYSLAVMVTDGVHTAETALTINVLDVNDNAPLFSSGSYSVLLNGHQNSNLLTAVATDADSGDNGRLRYSLEPSSELVKIDETTGQLFLRDDASLRKTFVSYLNIVARDSGSPSLQSSVPLRIQASNLAKKPYSFSEKNYTVQVSESAPIGSQVFNLPKEDSARATTDLKLSYEICEGNNDGNFIVDYNSGSVFLARELDRELRSHYELKLVAYPFRQQTTVNVSTILRVEVTDVNDTPPAFTRDRYEISLSEYTRVGTSVLTVAAEDRDCESEISYDITSGNELNHFAIDKADGSVVLMKELDFDRADEFRFIVRATDTRNYVLASLVGVTIKVKDENDNAPVFPVTRYNESISEATPAGTVIFTARASDRDRGHFGMLNYTILEGEAREKFSIDPSSGVVSSKIVFDYESKKHHYFTIAATDAGGKTAHVQVQVDIIGKDEYPPEFLKAVYHFTVPGNAPTGYSVGRVEATDIDSGPDGVVSYWMHYPNYNFNVNSTTGVIYVVKPMGSNERIIELTLSIEAGTGRTASSTSVTTAQLTIDFSLNASIKSEGVSDGSVMGWVVAILLTLVILVLLSLLLFSKFRTVAKDAKPDTATMSHPDVCRYPNLTYPPHYNEISHYDTPDEAHMTSTYDKRCVSSRSGDEDEEIRMINEGRMLPSSHPQGSGSGSHPPHQHHLHHHHHHHHHHDNNNVDGTGVITAQNTQEYLARLGIYNTGSEKSTTGDYAKIEGGDCDGLSNIIYEKLDDLDDHAAVPGRNSSRKYRPPAGSLNSIVHSEEEIGGSYNWDYLNDWSPQYHKLPKVFAEMAKSTGAESKVDHPSYPMAALSSASSSNGSRRSVIIERLPPTHQRPPPPPPTCVSR